MIFSVYSRVIVGLINWKMQLVNQNFPQFLPLCSTDASRTEHVAQYVIKQVSNTYILDRFKEDSYRWGKAIQGPEFVWKPIILGSNMYVLLYDCKLQSANCNFFYYGHCFCHRYQYGLCFCYCKLQSAICKLQLLLLRPLLLPSIPMLQLLYHCHFFYY